MKTRARKIRAAFAWMPLEELERLLALVDVLEHLSQQLVHSGVTAMPEESTSGPGRDRVQ